MKASSPGSRASGEFLEVEQLNKMNNIDLARNEEDGRSYKRKIVDRASIEGQEEMEVASNFQDKFLQLMKQLDKGVRKLTKIVADNPNTKKVIKETSLVIRSLMSPGTTTEMWTMMKTRDLQRGKEKEM